MQPRYNIGYLMLTGAPVLDAGNSPRTMMSKALTTRDQCRMRPANAMRSLPTTSIDSSKFLDTSRCGMFLKSFPRHPMRRHLPNHPLKQCRVPSCILFEATLSCVIFSANQPTPEQLSQLRSLVAQMSGGATVELGESGYIGTCSVLTGAMKHQSHSSRTC